MLFLQISAGAMEIMGMLVRKMKDRFKPYIPTSEPPVASVLWTGHQGRGSQGLRLGPGGSFPDHRLPLSLGPGMKLHSHSGLGMRLHSHSGLGMRLHSRSGLGMRLHSHSGLGMRLHSHSGLGMRLFSLWFGNETTCIEYTLGWASYSSHPVTGYTIVYSSCKVSLEGWRVFITPPMKLVTPPCDYRLPHLDNL